MEKVTMAKVVGFVLAVLFALVIGISMWALLIGDYMNSVMNSQAQQSLRIVGFAGALSALATWWVQGFAAKRGFVVRVLFALFIFVVAFCSFGGLLRVIYSHISYPNQQDWSLSGLYWASQSDLVSFVLFMLVPPRPAYAALILAASIYVALFGPREPKAVEI
jgi:fluoride ion exporter CrcB/FEX